MGVVEMLNLLKADLDKDTHSREVDEKDAQGEYEKMMADSAAKREADTKSVADKESAKADLHADLSKMGGEKKDTTAAAMAKTKQIQELHAECDWLVASFGTRMDA